MWEYDVKFTDSLELECQSLGLRTGPKGSHIYIHKLLHRCSLEISHLFGVHHNAMVHFYSFCIAVQLLDIKQWVLLDDHDQKYCSSH